MNEIQKLTRRLFTNSRIDVDFFMYLPSGAFSGKNRSTLNINVNPTLYIRYKPNKKIAEEYDYAKASFKVTPRNLFDVVNFFNTIIIWFFYDQYTDLFLTNDSGELVFNADYNKLSAKTHKGDYDSFIMQAIPTIVRIGDKFYEGIHLYVNSQKYCIPLTFQEVSILFGILRDFSFSDEITLSLLSYDYITKHASYEQLEMDGIRKTPFD